ncbi:MAG TPA: DUF3047 domain-containing protein [Polyangiaceae bacterium]|nr:DUF3047 domain-containing protein [Polyangiaceae bacterium]
MASTRFIAGGFATLSALLALWLALSSESARAAEQGGRRLPVAAFRVVERESGPTNYYRLVKDADPPFIRAEYHPPYETTVLAVPVAEADRASARVLSWRWRAVTLPNGGNECRPGKGDSAAVIYATWRRGLRWYTLKYVWSAVGPKGAVCDKKSNPFVAQNTVVLETGGPLSVWKSERVDLRAEFRKHFENGDASASVPDFLGVGIMTDGDQTHSDSSADYADFVLER